MEVSAIGVITMNRITPAIVTVVLLVSAMGMVPLGLAHPAASDTHLQTSEGNVQLLNETGNASDVPPGAKLSAVIGVQEAELEGEVDSRTFGIQVARAKTSDAKASVVSERLTDIQDRLEQLEQEKQALVEAKKNGTISQGQFQARMATMAARSANVKQLANQSAETANELPSDLLASKGINVTAIQALSDRANELAGPQVAEIARSIAGPSIGRQIAGDRGPGADGEDANEQSAQRAIDRAEQQIEAARDRIERAEQRLGDNASDNATAALEDARKELDAAESALAEAQTSMSDGNVEEAIDRAEAALDHAEAALDRAQDAIDTASAGTNGGNGSDGDGQQDGGTETPRDGGQG